MIDRSNGAKQTIKRWCSTSMIVLMLMAPSISLAQNNDDVVLTIVGQKLGDDAADVYNISYRQFFSFPEKKLQTSTQVTYGSHVFSGPLVRDVLDSFNLQGDTVRLEALNGYVVDVPLSDFRRFDVILAHTMSGLRLSIRHFGPIWVVYPRDTEQELQDIRYDMRWVWQLRHIVVFKKPQEFS